MMSCNKGGVRVPAFVTLGIEVYRNKLVLQDEGGVNFGLNLHYNIYEWSLTLPGELFVVPMTKNYHSRVLNFANLSLGLIGNNLLIFAGK